MKFINALVVSMLATAPAIAGTPGLMDHGSQDNSAVGFGGYAELNYGYVTGNDEGNYGDDNAFTYYGFEGSFGSAGNGGFGWQIDAHYEVGTFTDGDDYYESSGFTAHANYNLGGFTLGAFAGSGTGANVDDPDTASMFWYGIEGAKTFGDFALSARVGLASSDNDHNSLDFSDRTFLGAQARYFINDDLMITASVNAAVGNIHGDEFLQTDIGLEGTMSLGGSNFYGTAGIYSAYMNGDYNGGDEGQGGETQIQIGVGYLFGGGSLRDIYAGHTPMMNNANLTRMGVNTSTYD